MNGRIYDPLLGRMLSADLVVQAPGTLQAYNRYSYVGNNPLTLVDPTGYLVDVAQQLRQTAYQNRTGTPLDSLLCTLLVTAFVIEAVEEGHQAWQEVSVPDPAANLNPLGIIKPFDVGDLVSEISGELAPAPLVETLPGVAQGPSGEVAPAKAPEVNPAPQPGNAPAPLPPSTPEKPKDDNSRKIYRTMNQDSNGSWITSPTVGAPNGNQLGARTGASQSRPDQNPDFKGVTSPNDMVGPGTPNAFASDKTTLAGLSATRTPTFVGGGKAMGEVSVAALPPGLMAVPDRDNHVTIAPAVPMPFGVYQSLLNCIPWADTGLSKTGK